MKPCKNILTALLVVTLFTLLHTQCVDAGLSNYLPSMGYLNPFAWFRSAKTDQTPKVDIDRADNATQPATSNSSTTAAPETRKHTTVQLPFNSTSRASKTTTVQPITDATGSLTDLFTTKKPGIVVLKTGAKPKKLRIIKNGKVYESPASESASTHRQTIAFDDNL